MLNRTVVLLAILIAASSWQEASAKIIQVDFTAELVGADSAPSFVDRKIEGSYTYDDRLQKNETNPIGTLFYTELNDFRVNWQNETHFYDQGLLYHLPAVKGLGNTNDERNLIDEHFYVTVGEVSNIDSLSLRMNLSNEQFNAFIEESTPDYSSNGTQQGIINYVGNYGGIIDVENNNTEVLGIIDNLEGDKDSDILLFLLGDLNSDGSIADDEIIALLNRSNGINEVTLFFRGAPGVLSPAFEIDFASVFSAINSEQSLVPLPTSLNSQATLRLGYFETKTVDGLEVLETSTAEYQITSLVTTVLVPEPTSFATLILAIALMPRRRSGL